MTISPTEILPDVRQIDLSYSHYRKTARDCDALLWLPRNVYGRLIAMSTFGPFCHMTGTVRMHKRLWSVGYDESRGGVAVPLSTEVLRNPGTITVWRFTGKLNQDAVLRVMMDSLGYSYSWSKLVWLAARLLPLTWLVITLCPPLKRYMAKAAQRTPGSFCSASWARAIRDGDGRQIVRKPVEEITPNDYALSNDTRYLGTLVYP